MNLRFSARARLHLLAIQDYIEGQGNPLAARQIGERIREATEILRDFPFAGRPGRVPGTREWVVRRLPYIVVYRVSQGDPGEVIVLGVFHGRQSRRS